MLSSIIKIILILIIIKISCLIVIGDDGGEEPFRSSGVCIQASPDTLIEYVDSHEDVRFHILTETLDQTLGRRPRKY